MGLATYSNSKPTVLSYVTIFESLWNQTELYDHIRFLYEQLKAHDKLQQEFINIAAHELRTPVQPILGLAEMLRYQQPPASASQDKLIGAIIRNARRLLQLQEDILDVTRIESNLLKLDMKQFSLNQMLMQTMDDCRGQLDDSKVKLLYWFDDDVVVLADRNRLVQVVSNLLSNALKFTKEGTVHVGTERKIDGVIVMIRDSGIGIDSEIMPRLFTKFATRSEKGTGLGLFISKSIVEAHGGMMWAENNRGVSGATFAFRLPIVA
jgi:signal transduction histidine kinase